MDDATEAEIYDRLGQPWIQTVMRRDDEPPGPTAPEYMVEPVEYPDHISQWLMSDIQVIDFGGAFFLPHLLRHASNTTEFPLAGSLI
jgi:hypothetical protein